MKAVKVEYTVREDFVEKNKQNIQAVMEALKKMGDVGVQYSSWTKEDGKTFIHIVFQRDEKAAAVVPNLEEFKHFQKELKTALEVPPKAEPLEIVGSSFDM